MRVARRCRAPAGRPLRTARPAIPIACQAPAIARRTIASASGAASCGEYVAEVTWPAALPPCWSVPPSTAAHSAPSNRTPTMLLIDVPQRVDAGDRLLAEIAALGEADRQLVAADFLRQIVLVEIDAKERRAGFDPHRVKRRVAARQRTRPPSTSCSTCGNLCGRRFEQVRTPRRARSRQRIQASCVRPGPAASPPAISK